TPAFNWITGQPLCPIGHGNGCILLVAESGEVVWLKDDWLGYVPEESFPYALDTHFRADYGRTTWVDIDENELEQVLARLKPAEAQQAIAAACGRDPGRMFLPAAATKGERSAARRHAEVRSWRPQPLTNFARARCSALSSTPRYNPGWTCSWKGGSATC